MKRTVLKRAKATKFAKSAKSTTTAEAKPKRMSGLDAAAEALKKHGEPLSASAIASRIIDEGMWKTAGKTPAATIYSAIIREITAKGSTSRFRKVDRGRFAAN